MNDENVALPWSFIVDLLGFVSSSDVCWWPLVTYFSDLVLVTGLLDGCWWTDTGRD